MSAKLAIPKNKIRLVLVLFALTTLVGCDAEGGTGRQNMDRQEFIAGADSICKEYNEEFVEIGEVHTVKGLEKQTADVLDLYERQLERLRGLDPPSEIQGDYAKFLVTLEERNELVRRANEAAKLRDEHEVARVFGEGQELATREREWAEHIGFRECGYPPEPEQPSQEEGKHEHPPGTPEEHEHPPGSPEEH